MFNLIFFRRVVRVWSDLNLSQKINIYITKLVGFHLCTWFVFCSSTFIKLKPNLPGSNFNNETLVCYFTYKSRAVNPSKDVEFIKICYLWWDWVILSQLYYYKD